jgi:hypothetical protein
VSQFVASVAVLAIGLGLAFYGPAGEFRVFGWVLLAIGVLGLAARAYLARRGR